MIMKWFYITMHDDLKTVYWNSGWQNSPGPYGWRAYKTLFDERVKKTYLGVQSSQACRIFAGLSGALRTGLGLLSLLESIKNLLR